ncbi:conserved hypothetical protein [Candidatus Terasakiella magnetica]|nr:conserved hypothetical protein [Candidatus Terasakiella magnetica]
MKMRGVVLALAIAPLLGGCGIPDLVAHTVKSIEKRNEGGQTPSSPSSVDSQAATRPQTQTQPDEPPPPVSAPAPRRSSVSVEELPAR